MADEPSPAPDHDLLPDLPDWVHDHVVDPDEALCRTVRTGTRIGSGLGTSEPPTFYAGLWDHVLAHDISDLEIRQALFMAPHPILVGDAVDVPRPDLPGPLGSAADRVGDAVALRRLRRHLQALKDRRITFRSAFLGPVMSRMVPDTLVTRLLAPDLAGRNRVTAGHARYQPVHFPDGASALGLDDQGRLSLDLLVQPMTWPSPDGRLSFGLSNGVNGEMMDPLLQGDRGTLLLYLNRRLPFTTGIDQTIELDALRPLADQGRLVVVVEDVDVPGVPDGSLSDPDPVEVAIAENVVDSIVDRLEDTTGRPLQVGIGRISGQAVRRLGESPWTGRGYTEMLDPGTYDLLDDGTIDGTHVLDDEGRRQQRDGLACTFAMGEVDSDMPARMDGDERIIMMTARRLLQPAAFNGGLGINNVMAVDFAGNVNATSRDRHPYSAVGGLATIMRGLAIGGVAYLCMKSTHRGPDGQVRSSVMPALPPGTAVTLTAPDLLGTRDGARIHLVTEHGVADLHSRPLDDFVRQLIGVAHPDHRDELARQAWELYRISA